MLFFMKIIPDYKWDDFVKHSHNVFSILHYDYERMNRFVGVPIEHIMRTKSLVITKDQTKMFVREYDTMTYNSQDQPPKRSILFNGMVHGFNSIKILQLKFGDPIDSISYCLDGETEIILLDVTVRDFDPTKVK